MNKAWDHYAKVWDLKQRIIELKGALRLFGEDSPFYTRRAQELHDKELELKALENE